MDDRLVRAGVAQIAHPLDVGDRGIARAVGIGLAVLFGRRNDRRDLGDARGQRLVDAALVQHQRDAMRARQRRNGRDDLAHVDELRKGFCRQERADFEAAHAGGIFVADPALLCVRRGKCFDELQAVAQADLAQGDAAIGIDFLNVGHARFLIPFPAFLFELGTNRCGVGAERRHLQPFADIGAVPFDRQRRHAERRAIGVEIIDQPARPQHMRIVEQVLGTVDRREADVEAIELFGELRELPAPDDFRHARNDP